MEWWQIILKHLPWAKYAIPYDISRCYFKETSDNRLKMPENSWIRQSPWKAYKKSEGIQRVFAECYIIIFRWKIREEEEAVCMLNRDHRCHPSANINQYAFNCKSIPFDCKSAARSLHSTECIWLWWHIPHFNPWTENLSPEILYGAYCLQPMLAGRTWHITHSVES